MASAAVYWSEVLRSTPDPLRAWSALCAGWALDGARRALVEYQAAALVWRSLWDRCRDLRQRYAKATATEAIPGSTTRRRSASVEIRRYVDASITASARWRCARWEWHAATDAGRRELEKGERQIRRRAALGATLPPPPSRWTPKAKESWSRALLLGALSLGLDPELVRASVGLMVWQRDTLETIAELVRVDDLRFAAFDRMQRRRVRALRRLLDAERRAARLGLEVAA